MDTKKPNRSPWTQVKPSQIKSTKKYLQQWLGRRMAKQSVASSFFNPFLTSGLVPFAPKNKTTKKTKNPFTQPPQVDLICHNTETLARSAVVCGRLKPRAIDDISSGESPERNRKWNSTPGMPLPAGCRKAEAPRKTRTEVRGVWMKFKHPLPLSPNTHPHTQAGARDLLPFYSVHSRQIAFRYDYCHSSFVWQQIGLIQEKISTHTTCILWDFFLNPIKYS